MENTPPNSNKNDREIKAMACEDCFFFRSALSVAGPGALAVLKVCQGSIMGNSFCSTPDWKCGHPFMTEQVDGMNPLERLADEVYNAEYLNDKTEF